MIASGHDTATQRYHNALALFDEYVRATVSDPDAATLRGLERRFAERLEIQPSYWSQIKSRSRHIGERLARQFEQRCGKPAGWMDKAHDTPPSASNTASPNASTSTSAVNKPLNGPALYVSTPTAVNATPRDEDERFIIGLVLSYYRRHPQKARQRLLDLLGEMLVTPPVAPPPAPVARPAVSDDTALWLKTQQGVAPLKAKNAKSQR